jgi:hypothetical protein
MDANSMSVLWMGAGTACDTNTLVVVSAGRDFATVLTSLKT